jgi:hypothetical protein
LYSSEIVVYLNIQQPLKKNIMKLQTELLIYERNVYTDSIKEVTFIQNWKVGLLQIWTVQPISSDSLKLNSVVESQEINHQTKIEDHDRTMETLTTINYENGYTILNTFKLRYYNRSN